MFKAENKLLKKEKLNKVTNSPPILGGVRGGKKIKP